MSSDAITPEPKPDPIPSAIAPEPLPEAAPPPAPHFETRPYAADGSAPPLGLALTLGGGLAAAVLLGWLVSLIARWFYLVLLFPLGMGLVLGAAGSASIKFGKLRSPLLAGLAALLSGIMTMLTMHYADYQRALARAAEELPAAQAAALQQQISFAKFLDLSAEEGVTITRAVGKDKGMNLGYVGSYIYWLVEMGVVALIAWIIMRKRAEAPFCGACNTWKNERPLAMVMVPSEDLAVQAVADGDVVRLLECAGPIQAQGLLLKTAVCPGCGAEGEVDVAVDRVTTNSKGQKQTSTLTRATYPGEVLRYLPGGA